VGWQHCRNLVGYVPYLLVAPSDQFEGAPQTFYRFAADGSFQALVVVVDDANADLDDAPARVCQHDPLRASVFGVGCHRDVLVRLEMAHQLSHRLFGHVRRLCQVAEPGARRIDELEDRRVGRADIGESCVLEGLVQVCPQPAGRAAQQRAEGHGPPEHRISKELDYFLAVWHISHAPYYMRVAKEVVMQLMDLEGVRHRYISVGGVRLHLAESGDDAAPAVLLLHGFPQHWYAWRDLFEPLGRARHVIAVDMRGFGWSDAPRRGYSTNDRVRDVIAVLDQLGIAVADVVGHDFGASVAARMALDHPERVGRAILISMLHPWPMQKHLVPNTWRWWVTALYEYPGIGSWMLRTRPLVTEWVMTRDARDRDAWSPELLKIYSSVIAEPEHARAAQQLMWASIFTDIPQVVFHRDRDIACTAPMLVITGDQDALIPPAVVTVPPGRTGILTTRTVSGGHYLLDENPTEVLAAITTFLEVPHYSHP
jgi:pimeloyl-ACP methyl ester carboxylesterase